MALRPSNPSIVTIASGGVAVPLSSTDLLAYSCLVQADPSNAAAIFLGDSTVTVGKGIRLSAGDAVPIEAEKIGHDSYQFNLKDFYIISSSSGNSARVLAMVRRA